MVTCRYTMARHRVVPRTGVRACFRNRLQRNENPFRADSWTGWPLYRTDSVSVKGNASAGALQTRRVSGIIRRFEAGQSGGENVGTDASECRASLEKDDVQADAGDPFGEG